MLRRIVLVAFAAALIGVGFGVAEDKEKKEEFKAKCPVSGGAAKKDHAVEYKGAKVYLCCDNCPKAFEKDTAKYSVKANHQLVVTGQAKAVKCPLSGGKLNDETKIKVGDTEVAFCCNNCKGKVEKAEGDAQLELVFSDKAFEKGFEVKKAEKKK